MLDPDADPAQQSQSLQAQGASSEEEPSSGPSLGLLYSVIGLALIVATIVAWLIVAPFYHRR